MTSKQWAGFEREAVIEPDLPIIDTHHHIWSHSPDGFFQPYTVEELISDKAGAGHNVIATVMVDSHAQHLTDGPEALRPVGETIYCENEANKALKAGGKTAGICAAIVPYADLRLGAAVGEVLDAHAKASPRFRGIRYMLAFAEELPPMYGQKAPEVSRTPEFRAGVKELSRRGLSYELWLFQHQHAEAVELARAFPEMTIVLNHTGGPMAIGRFAGRREEAFAAWTKSMREIAACPNVVVKLGGTYVAQIPPTKIKWPERPATSQEMVNRNRDYILTAIELFSPSRCLFESNFPVDMLYTSYGNLWNSFKLIVSAFSKSEQADMFAGVARRVYRMDV